MSKSDATIPDPGVFLVKGDKTTVPDLSFIIDKDGKLTLSPVILETEIDMSPYWLDIAYSHLKATENAHKSLMKAKRNKDDQLISRYLIKESSEGMQAIVSSGIAIDAYYASIKKYVSIPKETFDAWKKKKTARYKQIAEVMRVGFALEDAAFKEVRLILKQNLNLRDQAVHPTSRSATPMLHVELNKFVDWRYANFRYYYAKNIYKLTLIIIYRTASKNSSQIPEGLRKHSKALIVKLKPIVRKWVRKYGELN